jgi:hypothetical protein
MVRKIQIRELTLMLLGYLIISMGGFLRSSECNSCSHALIANMESNKPTSVAHLGYSFVSRFAGRTFRTVPKILLLGAYSQIALSIVESITIAMIYPFIFVELFSDLLMHVNSSIGGFLNADGVKVSLRSLLSVPEELEQSSVVFVVDQGDLIHRQWDKAAKFASDVEGAFGNSLCLFTEKSTGHAILGGLDFALVALWAGIETWHISPIGIVAYGAY